MYNKIMLMGRLVAAPEFKITQNGIPYVRFRIAVNRRFHSKDEENKVDFFSATAWRGTAEFICKYFGKGNMIMIDGEMQSSHYTDKNGNPATWWEVSVDRVCFTGEPKKERDNISGYNSNGYNSGGNGGNYRSYGNKQNGGNAYEQAQLFYGKPPVNKVYGNGLDYGDKPPASDEYPF